MSRNLSRSRSRSASSSTTRSSPSAEGRRESQRLPTLTESEATSRPTSSSSSPTTRKRSTGCSSNATESCSAASTRRSTASRACGRGTWFTSMRATSSPRASRLTSRPWALRLEASTGSRVARGSGSSPSRRGGASRARPSASTGCAQGATIRTRTTTEAPPRRFPVYTPDAFQWAHLANGTVQDTGIGEAWNLLARANRLPAAGAGPRIGILDGGFAPFDADIPAGSVQMSSGVRPGVCSGGTPCPFHGNDVTSTAWPWSTTASASAGAGGPAARAIQLNSGGNMFSSRERLGRPAGRGARIINMSFGGTIPAVGGAFTGGNFNAPPLAVRAGGGQCSSLRPATPAPTSTRSTASSCAGKRAYNWPCETAGVLLRRRARLQREGARHEQLQLRRRNERLAVAGPSTSGRPGSRCPASIPAISPASPRIANVGEDVQRDERSRARSCQALRRWSWPRGPASRRRRSRARCLDGTGWDRRRLAHDRRGGGGHLALLPNLPPDVGSLRLRTGAAGRAASVQFTRQLRATPRTGSRR